MYAVHLKFVEQQLESQHKNDSVFGARQLSFCSLGNLTACSSRVIRAALRSSWKKKNKPQTPLQVDFYEFKASVTDYAHGCQNHQHTPWGSTHGQLTSCLALTYLLLPMNTFILKDSNFLHSKPLTRQTAYNFCVSSRAVNFTKRTKDMF